MSMTGKIGKLLTTIDNAVITMFEDNACITVITPSSTYEEDGVLLNIVIEILKFNYNDNEYKVRKNLFDEIIYSKSATETIEKAYNEYIKEDTSEIRKDELAIKIGKFLVKEILENTDDRTGLIHEVANKNNLNCSK